jgi:hypothetical protein
MVIIDVVDGTVILAESAEKVIKLDVILGKFFPDLPNQNVDILLFVAVIFRRNDCEMDPAVFVPDIAAELQLEHFPAVIPPEKIRDERKIHISPDIRFIILINLTVSPESLPEF